MQVYITSPGEMLRANFSIHPPPLDHLEGHSCALHYVLTVYSSVHWSRRPHAEQGYLVDMYLNGRYVPEVHIGEKCWHSSHLFISDGRSERKLASPLPRLREASKFGK